MSFLDGDQVTPLLSLTKHWEQIRDEYDRNSTDAISWPEPIHNGKWFVIGLRFQGQNLEAQYKAPITSELCSSIPGAVTFGFSVMKPGCVIERHTGYSKAVLRVHLGIHTNTSAAIEVGGEERTWKAGQLLMFDDTQVHSAWNRGDEDRVLLLVDIKRDAIESYLL